MNEQLRQLYEKAMKRLDLVTTGALVILLIISGYLYWREQSHGIPDPPPPPPRDWTVKLPIERLKDRADEEHVAAVERIEQKFIAVQPDITEDPRASRVVRVNMFDRKSADAEREVEAQINRDYLRAEALYAEQNLQEALRVLNSILERNPNHRLSTELKRQIEQALAPGDGG